MPENTAVPAGANAVNGANRFKEAVCIEAGRIFDSCSDKDCLEDLQVFFTVQGQSIIDQSALIKCKSAEVLDVYLQVEPVPFNKGFYAVDITFYFRISFSAYTSPVSTPVNVRGLAFHSKKVILFGSEGNVKTFYSGDRRNVCDQALVSNMPTAAVKTVDPITLGCRIVDCLPMYAEPLGTVPEEIAACFEGDFVSTAEPGLKTVLVTLGLFTIATLERSVQLMIPTYDYCVPEKDCTTSITPDDPCEMFKRIKFPVNDFFPENLNDMSSSQCD
ncbi:hypothetical protein LJC63_00410 [Ruminococcaceae bacterium OttesenSCG-928-L11]|nr:hypothetical protein [Ruminococcaceae bacterium OttesenSCG-928-L11]